MRFRIFSRALLFIVAAGAGHLAEAGLHPETGLYRFEHFEPKKYGASPQNWAVAQDLRGVMYFGNNDGVLEYDGANWRLIRVANGEMVRALAVDRSGRLYVGTKGDIGYLRPDAHGSLEYVSLKGKLAANERNFKDVWRVFTTPDGVYFSTENWLARLNTDGTLRTWHAPEKLGKAFAAGGSVYVRVPSQGVMRVTRDGLEAIPGGALAKTDVVGAVDLEGRSLVATTRDIHLLDASGLHPFTTGAEDYLAASAIYTLARLPGGEIAAGTRTGGLVLLNENGRLDRVVEKSDALTDVWVTAIATDRQGGVWLTHVNGITRFNPGLSRFTEAQGLLGDVFCVTRAGGTVYAGTNSGLFRMMTSDNQPPRFEKVEGIKESVFVLLPFGDSVLAGTSKGVFEEKGGGSAKVLETVRTIYGLSASPSHPDRVYAAGDDGGFVLQHAAGGWSQLAAVTDAGQLRTMAEDPDGTVWATSRDRIWHVDFRSVPATRQGFSVVSSVEWQNAYRVGDRVLFATQHGLMTFSDKLRKMVPYAGLGAMFADGSRDVFSVTPDARGNTWITGKNYHGVVHAGAAKEWQPMPLLGADIGELYELRPDPDGTVWAVGEDYKLFRWSPSLAGDPNRDFHVLTRRIEVMGAKEPLFMGAGDVPSIALPYRDNALHLEFAAPFYEAAGAVQFQYQLEGNDRGWSQWSSEPKADYPRLPEGSYRFRVRARNPHGVVTAETGSTFGIFAPWYRTWWAFGLYAILGAIFVWTVVQLRVRQLQEDKRRLENTVAERTVEIRQQRDEIHVQERKSHSLLLNILPEKVAEELKQTGAVEPVGFDDVTVCFTDFVGFTLSSEKMPPARLVDALNEYFTAFDEIISRYGLEKLKTIGDSYMFVSGLPERKSSHAVDAVMAAMEMVQVVKNLAAKSDGTGWNIRVGLHSGPVVAGVVGIRKFAFDIWGNTVNFAARMESSGVPGAVNMSERTCRLTRGLIDCEGRGHVKIKEGRELLMFLARGITVDFARRYEEEFGMAPRAVPSFEEEAEKAMICRL